MNQGLNPPPNTDRIYPLFFASRSTLFEKSDNFKLVSVSVAIRKADDSLVEMGLATLDANGLDWHYTASVTNSSMTGGKIITTATDTPGHQTEMIIML